MNLPTRKPPLLPVLLLGIGLGGFVDGIVLHQVLQWHHILSDEGCCPPGTVGGLEDNTLADGLFHAATWLAVLAGSVLATRAWQRGKLAPPWRFHLGGLLLGWGLFNLVEGIVDHRSSAFITSATISGRRWDGISASSPSVRRRRSSAGC